MRWSYGWLDFIVLWVSLSGDFQCNISVYQILRVKELIFLSLWVQKGLSCYVNFSCYYIHLSLNLHLIRAEWDKWVRVFPEDQCCLLQVVALGSCFLGSGEVRVVTKEKLFEKHSVFLEIFVD